MGLVSTMLAGAAMTMQPQASEASIAGPQGPLRGTFLAPPGRPRAAVVIIPGSGPTDRDGNNPLGVRAASYRLLAEALAQRGIATLRFDKRGQFASQSAIADGNAVTIAGYAADAAGWAREARTRAGLPCVWLLGHSEGGLVAIAARDAEGVCGLILVSAPGRPIGMAMREQLRANPANAPLLDQAMAAIDRIEAGQHVDAAGMHPALQPLFAPQVQDYMIDLLSHDPAAMLRGYARPVLIVQGLRDIQVGEADARSLGRALPAAQLALLPNVNHVLKEVGSDSRDDNIATYGNPALPLAASVTEAIDRFIGAHPAR